MLLLWNFVCFKIAHSKRNVKKRVEFRAKEFFKSHPFLSFSFNVSKLFFSSARLLERNFEHFSLSQNDMVQNYQVLSVFLFYEMGWNGILS